MSRILAVDTTGECGSIALIENHSIREEAALDSPDGFAHVLFGEIESMLARHGLHWKEIDGFAAASGPGSFTGVRVGLAAVKGLAEATGRNVIAISNLLALAWFGTKPLRATVLDARRGDIFGAVYDNAFRLVCDEVVMPLESWLATLPGGDLEYITGGISLKGVERVTEAPRLLAGAIGMIAASFPELARDPVEIDANYVRRSDAELIWRE